jgi:4-carboxymuconolactone decarboxylase
MARRRNVLGGARVDKSIANKNTFNADLIDLITRPSAIYCEVPAANHAVKDASAIVSELGLLKG